MSGKPLVSVVIIFLNAGKFIQDAVQSVFAQAYNRWELLLVDDGSADASTVIARQYADEYPERVRYLEHPGHANCGMSAARNLGIRHARGNCIAFLDADDIWFPQTLEEQVAILEAHYEAAMVYGPIQYWFSWAGEPGDRERDYVEKLGVLPDTVIKPPTLLPLFLRDKAAVPSGILVRREIVEQVGGFEDAFRGEYEDQVFCAKVCVNAPVFAASRCWYRYRQHADSCVSVGLRTGGTDSARLVFLRWLAAYLSSQRVKAPEVWRALRVELWRFTNPRAFYLVQRAEYYVDRIKRLLGRSWAGDWNPVRLVRESGRLK